MTYNNIIYYCLLSIIYFQLEALPLEACTSSLFGYFCCRYFCQMENSEEDYETRLGEDEPIIEQFEEENDEHEFQSVTQVISMNLKQVSASYLFARVCYTYMCY